VFDPRTLVPTRWVRRIQVLRQTPTGRPSSI
jgi:hypothetical protein